MPEIRNFFLNLILLIILGPVFFSIVEDRKVYKTSLNIKILVFF